MTYGKLNVATRLKPFDTVNVDALELKVIEV